MMDSNLMTANSLDANPTHQASARTTKTIRDLEPAAWLIMPPPPLVAAVATCPDMAAAPAWWIPGVLSLPSSSTAPQPRSKNSFLVFTPRQCSRHPGWPNTPFVMQRRKVQLEARALENEMFQWRLIRVYSSNKSIKCSVARMTSECWREFSNVDKDVLGFFERNREYLYLKTSMNICSETLCKSLQRK